jgi:chorismate mutase-like protein
MVNVEETSLEALRDDIDRIDDDLHDLLMRRAEVVARIADAKRGTADLAMRPGREAMVLRRLIGRHKGPLPREVVTRIWRELIAAMVRLQGPLRVAVCAPERSVGYWDLARGHYGTSTPMTLHRSPFTALRAVTERRGGVGVLPEPQEDDKDPWWPSLASQSEDAPRIIAKLPFANFGEGRFEGLSALVVAACESGPTGDDISLLILAGNNQISRARLNDYMREAKLDGHCTAVVDRRGDNREYLHLVEINDFVAKKDKRIDALLKLADEDIDRIIRIGGYAVPFRA